jgi:hypothetical protein
VAQLVVNCEPAGHIRRHASSIGACVCFDWISQLHTVVRKPRGSHASAARGTALRHEHTTVSVSETGNTRRRLD